jgi:hypothetical protein
VVRDLCDTPLGLKPCSFGLSRVVGTLRNAAWLRLAEYRSGQGKARRRHMHSCIRLLGGARPVLAFMPRAGGKHGPQLVLGILESRNTRLASRAYSVGTYPHGWRLFQGRYSSKALALPKPVDWVPVATPEQIADTVVNAVTFLPQAIRLGTRTLLSFQGTTTLFSQRGKKVEIHERQGFKPQAPNHWDSSPVACGGLKPCNVI